MHPGPWVLREKEGKLGERAALLGACTHDSKAGQARQG